MTVLPAQAQRLWTAQDGLQRDQGKSWQWVCLCLLILLLIAAPLPFRGVLVVLDSRLRNGVFRWGYRNWGVINQTWPPSVFLRTSKVPQNNFHHMAMAESWKLNDLRCGRLEAVGLFWKASSLHLC